MTRTNIPKDYSGSITDKEWVELSIRLEYYLEIRFPRLSKRGWDLGAVANQVFLDIQLGKRRWPPVDSDGRVKTEVELFPFLCWVARSVISHMWEREKKNVSIDYDPDDPHVQSIESLLRGSAHSLAQFNPNDTERMANYNRLTGKILQLVADDEVLATMIDLWRADPGLKPRDLAEMLSLPIEAVQAAQKRLRRRVQSLRDEFTRG
jgi:hypothetical protein